jgi:hypothetical protein
MSRPGGDGGGGSFSGIDPERLPVTISTLDSDREKLRSNATSFKSQFALHGLDTQPLDRMLTICSWVDDQMPMLRRRQHLAVAADQYAPAGTTVVWIDESQVTNAATGKASADGKRLADEFKHSMKDDTVPEGLYEQLATSAQDGDFVKAFYDELGPAQLFALSNTMASDPGPKDSDELKSDRTLIAETFATFTRTATDGMTAKRKHDYWNTWFDRFQDPIHGFRPDLLLPLISGGTDDKDFLLALGNRIFSPPKGKNIDQWMRGPGGSAFKGDHLAEFYTALSKNPEAAGEFMSRHPDVIDSGLTGGLNDTAARTHAFVDMVKAGTTGLHASDVKLSDQNTAMILTDNFKHANAGEHPLSEVSLMYSEMMAQHWDDLQFAVTSPAQDGFYSSTQWDADAYLRAQNPKRPGIEVSPGVWQSFMQESIRNPHAAASMSALFESSQKQYTLDISNATRSDNNSVSYLNFSKGLMGDFYATAFTATAKSLKDQQQQWVDDMNASRSTLVDTAEGLATGGPTAAVDMAKEKGQELAINALKGWINNAISVKPDDAPKDLLDSIKGLRNAKDEVNWRKSMGDRAAVIVTTGFPQKNLTPVSFNLDGKPSIIYTGDPRGDHGKHTTNPPPPVYIHGPRDDFVAAIKKNGGEVDVTKMTPSQRDAYARWMQDPAVVTKLGHDKYWVEVLGQGE